MQPLTASPRQHLNGAEVTALLKDDPSITVTYGAEWYDNGLNLVSDITEFMSDGSTISSDSLATIHRSCTLLFDSNVPFNYITDFIKPYMILTNNDNGFAARFNLGVYTMQTPTQDNSTTPSVLSFAGYDLLFYLDQPIGDSFEMQVGVEPVSIAASLIAQAVPDASVQLTDSGLVTTQVFTWPFDAQNSFTYLDVVNEILAIAGYSPVWVDWDGIFQCQPFVDPQTAPIEFTFDLTASDNVVAEQRHSIQDFFDVPNYWLFIMQNLTAAPVEGTTQLTYIDTDPNNPGSFTNRKRYVKKIMFVNALDFPTLLNQAVVTITTDLSPTETFSVSTSPLPLAWHKDIIALVDPNIEHIQPLLSQARRLQANQWTMTLDGSADQTWTCQTVNGVISQS